VCVCLSVKAIILEIFLGARYGQKLGEIIDNFDRKLFSKITHSGHCLHHLLPPLKPLNTVLTVLGKESTITSCLMLKFRCIKTVLLIDARLSLDDTLCVLYYFLCFMCFIAF